MCKIRHIMQYGTAKESLGMSGLIFCLPIIGAVGSILFLSCWGICKMIKK